MSDDPVRAAYEASRAASASRATMCGLGPVPDTPPELGQGSGEGGPRGGLPIRRPTVDDWLRATARGTWSAVANAMLDADAAALGLVRGHPDADGVIR